MKVICICPVVSGRLLECCDVAFVVNYTAHNVAVYASIGPIQGGPEKRGHKLATIILSNLYQFTTFFFTERACFCWH